MDDLERHLGSLREDVAALFLVALGTELYLPVGRVDSGPGIFWGTWSGGLEATPTLPVLWHVRAVSCPLAVTLQSGLSYFAPGPQSFEW